MNVNLRRVWNNLHSWSHVHCCFLDKTQFVLCMMPMHICYICHWMMNPNIFSKKIFTRKLYRQTPPPPPPDYWLFFEFVPLLLLLPLDRLSILIQVASCQKALLSTSCWQHTNLVAWKYYTNTNYSYFAQCALGWHAYIVNIYASFSRCCSENLLLVIMFY